MADTVNVGGVNYSTDDVTSLNGNTVAAGTNQTQRIKVQYGDDNSARDVSSSFPMPTTQPSSTVQSSNLAMTATGNVVSIGISNGASVVGLQVTGTWTGTIAFEATTDGSTFFAINGVASVSGLQVSSTTASGQWRFNAGGYASVRVRSSVAGTGTAVVTLIGDPSATMTTLAEPLPAGTAYIGSVGIVASPSFSMTTGTLSAATVPGNPNTTSTTSATVANVATAGNVTVYLYGGTYTALTLAFEVSPDGTNWFAINAARVDGTGTDLAPSYTAAGVRAWEIVMPGVTYFRVRATAITQTVAPTVVIAPGGIVYDPSPVVTGSVAIAPVARTTGTATGNVFRTRVAPSTVTASTALVAAPGAGLSIHLTDLSVSNAGGTINTVSLLDGSTNVMDMVAAASGGGGSMNFQTPIKCTAATALNYTTSAASQTYITVTGYIA